MNNNTDTKVYGEGTIEELDLFEEVYARVIDVDPNKIMESYTEVWEVLEKAGKNAEMDVSHVNLHSAAEDYIARIRYILEPMHVEVSDDGRTATLKGTYTDRDIDRLTTTYIDRILAINVPTLLASHIDDGYVVTPSGRIFSPKDWDWLVGQMEPGIRERVFRDYGPCTNQDFADAYNDIYEFTYGLVWEPYQAERA